MAMGVSSQLALDAAVWCAASLFGLALRCVERRERACEGRTGPSPSSVACSGSPAALRPDPGHTVQLVLRTEESTTGDPLRTSHRMAVFASNSTRAPGSVRSLPRICRPSAWLRECLCCGNERRLCVRVRNEEGRNDNCEGGHAKEGVKEDRKRKTGYAGQCKKETSRKE